jgi:hypothetical protein
MTTDNAPWSAFEPSADDPWDLRKVAHLHRRAGFGATWGELRRDLEAGPAASVKRLLHPGHESPEGRQVLDGLRQGVLRSRDPERLKAWWLYRMAFGADPLREKMTLFWHGHFATSQRKVDDISLMVGQNELFRRHALGDFATLLTEVLSDPAMLVWLDGVDNRKGRPNENLARETLELFTLGRGHYTERDVRESARALTGSIRGEGTDSFEPYRFPFDATRFDSGEKTVLGQSGPWKGDDLARIVGRHPATLGSLARKLYRVFVSEGDDPSADLIRPLAEALRGEGDGIGRAVGMILRSRHFYSRAAIRQRIKGPVEFNVALVRTLEVPRGSLSLPGLSASCDRQGQELFFPPNVAGWEGGKSWINSSTLIERSNWAADVLWGNPETGQGPYDPSAWGERHGVAADRAASAFAELLLQGDLGDEARALILGAGSEGRAEGLRKALLRLVNCPESHLA